MSPLSAKSLTPPDTRLTSTANYSGDFCGKNPSEPPRHKRRRRRRRKRRTRAAQHLAPPVHILLCEDFAVNFQQHSFQLASLIADGTRGGVVSTDLDLFGRTLADVHLSGGSFKMLQLPNAGGSSVLSEVMSCEMLHRCYGATLLKVNYLLSVLISQGRRKDIQWGAD